MFGNQLIGAAGLNVLLQGPQSYLLIDGGATWDATWVNPIDYGDKVIYLFADQFGGTNYVHVDTYAPGREDTTGVYPKGILPFTSGSRLVLAYSSNGYISPYSNSILVP